MYAMLFRVLVGLYSCIYVAQKNAKKIAYKEDVASVKDSFHQMLEKDVYKADLFSDL